MKYKPELGFFGNLTRAFSELTNTNRNLFNETSQRTQADLENRESVEQSLTELYLDGVQAQQDITEIQLQLLEG